MEDFEEEIFEVVKGDYRTLIICKFNKKGFLVSHVIKSTSIIDEVMFSLKESLIKALSEGDSQEVSRLQDLINKKRKSEEKPTF